MKQRLLSPHLSSLFAGFMVLWLLGIGCTPIPKPECEKDANCNTGQVCNDGKCVDKEPTNTDECPNADGGNCPGCKQDSDCNNDQKCVSGQCVEAKECTTDDDCKGKAQPFCSSEGKCALECKEDTHCKDKTKPFCSSANLCEWECKQDSDCKDDKACQNNRCILSGPECREDVDCKGKAREFCSDAGKCEWQCKTNEDCDAWNETCEQNVCKPKPGSCKTDKDCQQGEVCLELRCVKVCLEDKDCPNATCGGGRRQLRHCTTPCKTQAECADGFICIETTSQEKRLCIPWAPAKGKGKRGEDCHNLNNPCDGTKQLYCAIVDSQTIGKCAKTCRIGKEGDCEKDEVCERFSCEPSRNATIGCPHLGGTCVRKGNKQEGESCDRHPEGAERCAPGLQCDASTCQKLCDPAKEKENPVCGKDRRCLPFWRSLTGGLCFLKGTQTEGQFCNKAAGPFVPSSNCAEPFFCDDVTCVKPCDVAKGKDNNPDCGAAQQCLPNNNASTGGSCVEIGAKEGESCTTQAPCIKALACEKRIGGTTSVCSRICKDDTDCSSRQRCLPSDLSADKNKYCREKCDPNKGFVLNSDCKGRTFCESTPTDPLKGHCLPLEEKPGLPLRHGPFPLYGLCGLSAPLPFQGCNINKGQRCIFDEGDLLSRCFQSCDPKKGVLSNTACNGGVCREWITPEGGICEPLGTAKEGEACSLQKGCDKGLVCYGFKCAKACDPTKANACAKGSFCWRQRCVKECDLSEGISPNPTCGSKMHCSDPRGFSTWYVHPTKSYCESNAYLPPGSRQEGAYCTNKSTRSERQCDPTKGLVCNGQSNTEQDNTCRPVCDAAKGFFNNPSCQKGQVCLTGTPHHAIGRPKQGGGYCAFACQPENGLLADCPQGMVCKRSATTYNSYGFCETIAPEQGPRELGETCQKAQACNGNKQLFCKFKQVQSTTTLNKTCSPTKTPTGCDPDEECLQTALSVGLCYKGTCTQACTIGASSNNCKATEQCTTDTNSPTGGSCTPRPAKKLGEDCEVVPCIAGLSCLRQIVMRQPKLVLKFTCVSTCDTSKEKLGAPQCSGTRYCSRDQCVPLPPQEKGPKLLGESCTTSNPSGLCDGSKSIYCENVATGVRKCVKVCDRNTGAGCGNNELCQLSAGSYTGAGCFPKRNKKANETCTIYTDCFGEKDLYCASISTNQGSSKSCQKTCNPTTKQGCGANQVCAANKTSPTGGGCFPKVPPAGPRDWCKDDQGATCAQGLICACDPVGSTSCACIAENAKEGNYCNGLQWRCAKGLTCWGGRCLKECDMNKGTTSNPACKATESCKKATTSSLGGMCFPQ